MMAASPVEAWHAGGEDHSEGADTPQRQHTLDAARPNFGATIPDVQAMGEDTEPASHWRQRMGIDVSRQIRIVRLAHMRYRHPDLGRITLFLQDFGMSVAKRTNERIWYRGYGTDQYVYYAERGVKEFLGGTFEVESMGDLEKAAKLDGAGEIQPLDEAPGGGYMVSIIDPEGFPINLMYGQTPRPPTTFPPKVVYNYEDDKPRVRKFNRFEPGPAAIHKLGHYGLCTQELPRMLQWYTCNFNFVPTDFLYVSEASGSSGEPQACDKREVGVFMHIDRGGTPVDHHTLFLTQNRTAHVHHASFEVHDFDTQHLGHQWLADQGYKSVWGVGRHVLGSQISPAHTTQPLRASLLTGT